MSDSNFFGFFEDIPKSYSETVAEFDDLVQQGDWRETASFLNRLVDEPYRPPVRQGYRSESPKTFGDVMEAISSSTTSDRLNPLSLQGNMASYARMNPLGSAVAIGDEPYIDIAVRNAALADTAEAVETAKKSRVPSPERPRGPFGFVPFHYPGADEDYGRDPPSEDEPLPQEQQEEEDAPMPMPDVVRSRMKRGRPVIHDPCAHDTYNDYLAAQRARYVDRREDLSRAEWMWRCKMEEARREGLPLPLAKTTKVPDFMKHTTIESLKQKQKRLREIRTQEQLDRKREEYKVKFPNWQTFPGVAL